MTLRLGYVEDAALTYLPLVSVYVSVNRVSIVSDNGLSPIRRLAIILTDAGLLSIEPLATISVKF